MDRQLTIEHERARINGPRIRPIGDRSREHQRILREVRRRTQSEHPARAEALASMHRSVAEFLRALGVGGVFQCSDVTRWIDDRGARPDPALLDMRALGGMLAHCKVCGIITPAGRGPTGMYGASHSSIRPKYRIDSLDLDRLDWIGIEGGR